MSTFGILQSRIADDIQRSDLTTQIQDAIKDAIDQVSHDRYWFNESNTTFNFLNGQEYYSYTGSSSGFLPTDLLQIDSLRCEESSNNFEQMDLTTFHDLDGYSVNAVERGTPDRYAWYGERLRVYPIPDQTYRAQMAYLLKPAALSASGDSNVYTINAFEFIRCKAKELLFSHVIYDEAQLALMERQAEKAKNDLYIKTMHKKATWRIKTTDF